MIPKETAHAYGMEPARDPDSAEMRELVTTANGAIPVSVIIAESMRISHTKCINKRAY